MLPDVKFCLVTANFHDFLTDSAFQHRKQEWENDLAGIICLWVDLHICKCEKAFAKVNHVTSH
jgi:hypothetical protein